LAKAKAVAKFLLQMVEQNPGVSVKSHFYHMDAIPVVTERNKLQPGAG